MSAIIIRKWGNNKINAFCLVIFVVFLSVQDSFAQSKQLTTSKSDNEETEIINLSKEKWLWMAEKDVEKLERLFHDSSRFVHMSGTWKKDEELNIIKTGSIWYKKADVHDVVAEIFDNTAIIWSRITLDAIVRGNVAVNQFTVTEVYKKSKGGWKLLDLTFSSVRDTHHLAH